MAIIPPEPVRREIQAIKVEIAEKYQTERALRSPPHITLVPPFRFDEESIEIPLQEVRKLASEFTPFVLKTKALGTFAPRVVFLEVEESQTLSSLHFALKQYFESLELKSLKFHPVYRPHITLAFRDLEPPDFEAIVNTYADRKWNYRFEVKSLWLLRNRERSWEVVEEVSLINN